jgi:hypothetical protein
VGSGKATATAHKFGVFLLGSGSLSLPLVKLARLPCKVAGSLKPLSDVDLRETAEANGRARVPNVVERARASEGAPRNLRMQTGS